NIEIPGACSAAPLVRTPEGDVVLKRINACEAALFERLHLVIDAALFVPQWLQLALPVVNDSDGRAETEFQRTLAYGERVLRVADPATDYGIDIRVKVGVFSQHLQLFVEDLKALLRNVVRIDVVYRNLQPFKPRTIQPLDPLGNKQIAVRNHSGNDAATTNPANNFIQLGMQQRLAA